MSERIEDAIVLYVDDEWTNRVVFEQNFGSKFRVKPVGSAREALELLKSEPVAVIVADQRMPDMTGNDLLRQVKERYPKVVRVVVTAYADQDPLLKAVNEGLVARYIIKPWTRSEIERTLEWALDAWRHFGEHSEIHLRLLRAERLITLGVIAEAIFHDFGQPVASLVHESQRLALLVGSWPELVKLVQAHAMEVPEPHRALLLQLCEEMPKLAGDLDTGINLVERIRHDVDRILNPSAKRPIAIAQDPMEVIRYVTGVFQRRRLDLKLAYEGPSLLPKLTIGTTELAQVMINLVSNALQSFGAQPWKPPDGARVVIHAAIEAEAVRFAVEDNGRGMPPEVVARAGTLFFSTHDAGSGIGLAQCRRLVEAAKGTLSIESVVGHGTTIAFSLPKAL